MEKAPKTPPQIRFADKEALRRKMDELNRRLGIEPVPDITIEKLREMMKSEKIRPEDNEFSREIIRMRYGEDAE